MVDQNTFLETLRVVAEIAGTSDADLSDEEIHRYFAGMDLSAEQEEMISQYLRNPLETAGPVKADGDSSESYKGKTEACSPAAGCGDAGAGAGNAGGESGNDTSLEQLSDSVYYRMYLNEVREKDTCSDEKLGEFYQKLIMGENTAGEIADAWLMRIIRLAGEYRENPVNMQDLIQEGNIALWMALGEIPGDMAVSEMDAYLEKVVRHAFEAHIREVTGDVDQTQAVLAKAGLLHEAQAVLAKENGQTPSLRELSEYTHVPVEEIQSVLALYEQQGN